MTVAEFLADRPDWLPEPGKQSPYAAEWTKGQWRWVSIKDLSGAILCEWCDGSDSGEMLTVNRDRILGVLRFFYPPSIAEQLAALPLITGITDN